MVGLGMAYYARGNYDDAVKAFLKGADLDPTMRGVTEFLSRATQFASQADEVIERFRRLLPAAGNGLALYYYAMSLWKGKRAAGQFVEFGANRLAVAAGDSATRTSRTALAARKLDR